MGEVGKVQESTGWLRLGLKTLGFARGFMESEH